MKAKNETAERFQAFIADEVIPSIRKHGVYMTPETLEARYADSACYLNMLAITRTGRKIRELSYNL